MMIIKKRKKKDTIKDKLKDMKVMRIGWNKKEDYEVKLFLINQSSKANQVSFLLLLFFYVI